MHSPTDRARLSSGRSALRLPRRVAWARAARTTSIALALAAGSADADRAAVPASSAPPTLTPDSAATTPRRPAPTDAPPTGVAPRGPMPLATTCEASGAVALPGRALLVADDEEPATLTRYRLVDGRVVVDRALALPPGGRPHDIEALASGPDGRVVVVGSHGRGRKGGGRKRARVLSVSVDGQVLTRVDGEDNAAWLDAARADAARGDVARCGSLFVEGARAAAAALCPNLELEVEAALVDDGGRLWLGLRRPLVQGRAVFVRRRVGAPGFDRVAFVDVGGGLRDATRLDTRALLLSGPSDDGDAPGALSLVDLGTLFAGGRVDVVRTAVAVPAHAEAVAVVGDDVVVLTDGKREGDRCVKPATAVVVPVRALFSPPPVVDDADGVR